MGLIGVVESDKSVDYLYRLTLSVVIRDKDGNVLVVRERGRDYIGLPGGGINHGETIHEGLKRELREEVGLHEDFEYKLIAIKNSSTVLKRIPVAQFRMVFEVFTSQKVFNAGPDADEILFVSASELTEINEDFIGLKEHLGVE